MKFTVFTPTYNRAHVLPRLFASLMAQARSASFDFEWLIIDDGSTDDTEEVVGICALQADFPIKYVFQPHGGKHIAHNTALTVAQGEFFLVVDSDDELVAFAVWGLHMRWESIPEGRRHEYCGVSGLCIDGDGKAIGDFYPEAATHSTLRERRYVHKIRGEHWGSMRTDVCRKYPFPNIAGFVPEGLVWLQIAKDGYKDYCVNDVFRVYHTSESNRLSHVGLNRGKIIYARQMIKRDWRYARHAPIRFLKAGLLALISPFLLPLTSR